MIPPNLDITLLSLDQKLELRKAVQKEISTERRNKNLRIETFIPALKINDFIHAKEWAFSKGFIAKNTNWAFTKFAVLNTIDLILTEIKTELDQASQIQQNQDNLNVPILPENQPHTEYHKPRTIP